MRRVVITGMGTVSPIGNDLAAVEASLRAGTSGVRYMSEWDGIEGFYTRVAAPPAEGLDEKVIARPFRRSMGPQAIYSALAARQAVAQAGLPEAQVKGGRCGLSIGSTLGSAQSIHDFFGTYFEKKSVVGIKGTAFLQCMGHTCAANVALMLGITGRVLAPLSACTSGSQGIGAGFEAIRSGAQDVMICGGADEAHFTAAITFDLVRGTSTHFHDRPQATPRPFDADRDGLVVGGGSGIVVLEALEHAQARGAEILAEVIGYATNCDGNHISQPQQEGMEACMRLGLASAGVRPEDVDYVNAHATATPLGDVVEARATAAVFGGRVPVSSTKGQTGHTMGACGALETIFTVLMMRGGFIAPTRNLERIDPECEGIQQVQTLRESPIRVAVKNNFAFGGVNTTLVLRAFSP